MNKCLGAFILSLLVQVGCSKELQPIVPVVEKPVTSKQSITDMVLIYEGGAHRKEVWNTNLFEPYVVTKDQQNNYHWMFDAFLFLEIKDGNGRGFASYYEKLPARKQEWQTLINRYFQPGNAICALNDCIEQFKSKVGKAPAKRQVVVFIPEPIPNQKDWGDINGEAMDFSKQTHRINAIKWFIRTVQEKFKSANLQNLELHGFYWVAEEATNSRDLTNEVSQYLRQNNYSFNWIPYFTADGWKQWKSLGFHKAWLQPNYFFKDYITFGRLDSAFQRATANGMSLELEFDDNALKKYGKGYKLENYLNVFQERGGLDSMSVAYYQGGSSLYKLWTSPEAEDKALYRRLADIIVRRQENGIRSK